jgi:phage terminase large subunit-like protein
MAWQQHVADVGLELNPDGSLAYREVIVSVPRQNGKTQLVLTAMCARCLLWGREQRVAYTAQTGKAARSKFKDDHKPLIERSDLKHLVRRFYMSDGNTSLVWENGSRISVLDNSPEAGHGMTLDLAIIDEAFEAKDNLREQALLPTMATRQSPQVWNVSTAGTADSSYLLRKTEIGRAAVAAGDTEGVAYFEWSIPDDADIDDPGVWADRMPAYGVTIHDEFIRHARKTMPEGEFRRAVGNQWTDAEERLIPGEFWAQVSKPGLSASQESGWFAVDGDPDRGVAAVAVSDGLVLELAEVRSGFGWLEGWLVERGRTVAVDRSGPVANIGDRVEKRAGS